MKAVIKLISILLSLSLVHAGETSRESSSPLGISINTIEIQINVNKYVYRDETDYPWDDRDNSDHDFVTFGNSSFLMEVGWKDKILSVVKLNLSSLFDYEHSDEISFTDDFDEEHFVENLFFEFREIGGEPVVVLIGKSNIFMGLQQFGATHKANGREQFLTWRGLLVDSFPGVLGAVIKFDVAKSSLANALPIIDHIDIMIYEDNGWDFDWDDKSTTMAIRLEKMVADTTFVLSYVHREHESINGIAPGYDDESTFIFGAEKEITGSLTLWSEGVLFKNNYINNMLSRTLNTGNQYYGSTELAFSVGASYDLTEETSLKVVGTDLGPLGREAFVTLETGVPFLSNYDNDRLRLFYQYGGYERLEFPHFDENNELQSSYFFENDHLFGLEFEWISKIR